jgi:hypothetical protein
MDVMEILEVLDLGPVLAVYRRPLLFQPSGQAAPPGDSPTGGLREAGGPIGSRSQKLDLFLKSR